MSIPCSGFASSIGRRRGEPARSGTVVLRVGWETVMENRREFLKKVAASGALAWSAASSAQSVGVSKPPSLRVLILGGTGAIGPYHVRAAVARGHRVSV